MHNMHGNGVRSITFLWNYILIVTEHSIDGYLAPEHDGAKDGDGDDEHRAVAANLLVAPNLGLHSIRLKGLEKI